MMTALEVITIYSELENADIKTWINGGWGVDAHLGKQTRPHQDLDIFIREKDVPKLRKLLEIQGYQEVKLEIARPYNFVLGDAKGHEIDVHVITFDGDGNAVYGPAENGDIFPATMLDGIGVINGQKVKCIAPEWMIKWHTGYKLRDSDYHDVIALCDKFGIDYPPEYMPFKKTR
jgi:lincosamide nucleotidyltransferase A/C/D/E